MCISLYVIPLLADWLWNFMQGSGDQSPNGQHKSTTLVKNRYAGNQMSNGLTLKHDGKEKVMALFFSVLFNEYLFWCLDIMVYIRCMTPYSSVIFLIFLWMILVLLIFPVHFIIKLFPLYMFVWIPREFDKDIYKCLLGACRSVGREKKVPGGSSSWSWITNKAIQDGTSRREW